MRRDAAIASIVDLCRKGEGFRPDAASLAAAIATPDRPALVEALLECGVIPESFEHDSTEEKLYAKYCDVLLAKSLGAMGITSGVILERAGVADVQGETPTYSIVGDAKAFRLSRTAKNQKDFKVTALSGWRGNKTYACLVGPLYQYPNTRSQIYQQATTQNVTLLGYVHLAFLVEHTASGESNLPLVWKVGARMQSTNKATAYWQAIDESVSGSVGKTMDDLGKFKKRERDLLEAIKKVKIAHLKAQVEHMMTLTKEDAIQRLISEMNIPSRINQINKVTY